MSSKQFKFIFTNLKMGYDLSFHILTNTFTHSLQEIKKGFEDTTTTTLNDRVLRMVMGSFWTGVCGETR